MKINSNIIDFAQEEDLSVESVLWVMLNSIKQENWNQIVIPDYLISQSVLFQSISNEFVETRHSRLQDEKIQEYIDIFRNANPEKRASIREVTPRWEELLKDKTVNTNVDEIIAAAKLYVSQTNPKYLMLPHYFIKKGVGKNATYTIINVIEELRRREELGRGKSQTRTLN